jgi:hypothetical protein
MCCQQGRKLTPEAYIRMLTKHRKKSGLKNSREILLQHENARLNTSFKPQKAVTKFG